MKLAIVPMLAAGIAAVEGPVGVVPSGVEFGRFVRFE
jgi:hypothetical protein